MPLELALRTRPIAPEPASKRARVQQHAHTGKGSGQLLQRTLHQYNYKTHTRIQPFCDSNLGQSNKVQARTEGHTPSFNSRRSSLPCARKSNTTTTTCDLTSSTSNLTASPLTKDAPARGRRRSLAAAQPSITQHSHFAASKAAATLDSNSQYNLQVNKTILGQLPVNHAFARSSASMLVKRARPAADEHGSAAPIAPKMTRRMSGALLGHADDEAEEDLPSSKRKRPVRASTCSRRNSSSELDKDGSQAKRRRSRPASERDSSSRRTSRRNSSSSAAQATGAIVADEQPEQDEYCLYEASARELCSLTRSELARLFGHATGRSLAASGALSKVELAQGIVRARVGSSTSYVVESDEEESDSDSPRPFTSHEASPAPSPHRRLGRTRSSRSSAAADHDDNVKVVAQRPGRTRGHMRTRSESLTDVFAAASLEDSSASKPESRVQLRPRRRSSLRDAAATELDEHEVGKRLQSVLRDGHRSPRPRQRRSHLEALEEATENKISSSRLPSYTPIAFRTRGTTTVASPTGSPRPTRAAKAQATARIVQRSLQEASSEESASADDLDMDLDDAAANVADATPRQKGRHRISTATPSDADDESDDESADELSDKEDNRDTLVALQGTRQLRNGKVVPLIEEVFEDITEDQAAEAEEDENNDMDDNDDEVDLMTATSKTLLRYRRDDLLRLCEERGVELDGTKKELVQALLQWRETYEHADSDASTASTDSTVSNASVMTARAETKMEALRAAASPKPRRGMLTPLLMREGHSPSPEKPKSPERTKEDEQEEVNALDLESLQLQDKEIAPEKLTKLEKVGSGGFKDVYKGLYRKKTIAIADIRGHLTEMDIKELGLLRDLRHPNIVHFIGVSIPKEPSSVPVMIVTELCANGDLFDYIRAVDPPPFLNMLEILLGIARGLEYLHTRAPTIIHRDIKSSNILITANGVAKLADFGLAKIKNSKRAMIRSLVGTVNWQAPELWVPHPRYNEKVDVYSVGLVFWEALQWHQPVKRYPFEGMNEHAIYDQVGHKNLRPSTASLRRVWGGEIVDLMSAMWSQEAVHRPPMTEVVSELERLIKAERERIRQERRRN
ncbi:hypothetical protein ACM66B_004980 [Microbotryomycetes sp. NB124-2]